MFVNSENYFSSGHSTSKREKYMIRGRRAELVRNGWTWEGPRDAGNCKLARRNLSPKREGTGEKKVENINKEQQSSSGREKTRSV